MTITRINTNTVTRVKGNSESSYRTGDVNLTAANIGAAASSHSHAGILKAVDYQSASATGAGTRSYTHTAPSGYTLLVKRPLGAYASGNSTAYVTDRAATQSGTTVGVSLYVHNPNNANVIIKYTLLYVKNEFA